MALIPFSVLEEGGLTICSQTWEMCGFPSDRRAAAPEGTALAQFELYSFVVCTGLISSHALFGSGSEHRHTPRPMTPGDSAVLRKGDSVIKGFQHLPM